MTEQQQADYALILTVDPTITEEDFIGMGIRFWEWDSKKPEAIKRRLQRGRETLYRSTFLVCTNKISKVAGRCFKVGEEDWSRKDRFPLTQKDIDNVNALSYGQYTGTRNKAGDMVAHLTWQCDSSD